MQKVQQVIITKKILDAQKKRKEKLLILKTHHTVSTKETKTLNVLKTTLHSTLHYTTEPGATMGHREKDQSS